ncbi:MAG: DUF294 nucleotidyltransferase-like domain-containing protein [Alphaproteobacteria bacterium]|nr:DUF294 nucleotidyltransferase-like domain-containing protein [Alphaproteobacteria bacterium]
MIDRKDDAGAGAVPLVSLDAVALDTETTGLDTGKDRIVQIGAVALSGGAILAGNSFDRMVDPDMPIPPSSTAIHGLSDEQVRLAETARETLPALADWIGTRVVIGYAIGFDLAILKAEHGRLGIPWRPYRSLCIRQLASVAGLRLPAPSLNAIAERLGIAIEGRHSALGDARAAAAIYIALLPRLAERGIATLAQAERACLALTSQADEEAKAGWQPAIAVDRVPKADFGAFARVDSFPFRYRVADIMSTPPAIVVPAMSLGEALNLLTERKISSVFVSSGAGTDIGILTERDITRAIRSLGARALNEAVGLFATRPLVTVPASEFLYRANTLMIVGGFRHLGVLSADGALVGALSARDLLKQRVGDAVFLAREIDHAEAPADLGKAWANLTRIAGGLVAEEVDARIVASVVSRELRALTRRASEFAEREMAVEGFGPPPAQFAVLILGSGGRGESLLAMDQDNAIVYASGVPGGSEDRWFEELGRRLADILDGAGVSYCQGGVMARNAEWRMDLDGWRRKVGGWIERSLPEDVLNCDIFFDSMPVYGDAALGKRLHSEALDMASRARAFQIGLCANAVDFTPPLGMFGRLRLKKGRLDIKRNAIMPIFSAARILAIRHGIHDRSTPARLHAASELADSARDSIGALVEAHRILLDELLAQQLRDIGRGIPHGNLVAPKQISAPRQRQFRWALEQVDQVRGVLGMPVFG